MTEQDDELSRRKAEQDRLLHRGNDVPGAALAGAGLEFGAAIVVSALAGMWLDKRYGTGPWLLLVSVFVGAGAGFWAMYRLLIRSQEKGK